MSVAVTTEKPPRKTSAKREIRIRDARQSDLPPIIRIYNAAIRTRMSTAQLETVTLEGRRDWLNDHSPSRHPFWVLEIDGQIAGWLTLKSFLPRGAYRDTAEVSVYVNEKFRRRGVGRALLSEAISRAPELGIMAMIGLIFAHNQPSLRLFSELGFEKWGLLPGVARLDGVERDLTIVGWHA
ncbi:MAG TPA: GNAT family N-acetyltransferase [Chthoniobacterales bacterium]|nr:GNAT family N-acetyltransferase [Chthoniobacterales bacterium]